MPFRGWAGVALAFSGVTAIAFGEGGGFHFQPMALLVLGASISTAIYFVIAFPLTRVVTRVEKGMLRKLAL